MSDTEKISKLRSMISAAEKKIDEAKSSCSDSLQLVEIGTTEEVRLQAMLAFIASSFQADRYQTSLTMIQIELIRLGASVFDD